MNECFFRPHLCTKLGQEKLPKDGAMNEMTLSPDTGVEIRSLRPNSRRLPTILTLYERAEFCFLETWMPERGSNPRSPAFQARCFNHCTRAHAFKHVQRNIIFLPRQYETSILLLINIITIIMIMCFILQCIYLRDIVLSTLRFGDTDVFVHNIQPTLAQCPCLLSLEVDPSKQEAFHQSCFNNGPASSQQWLVCCRK